MADIEKIQVDGETYYTYSGFAEIVERAYEYVRHCAVNQGQGPDLSPYVERINGKPFIHEDAISFFRRD